MTLVRTCAAHMRREALLGKRSARRIARKKGRRGTQKGSVSRSYGASRKAHFARNIEKGRKGS